MFVVFEGIDGSGKTTISNRVAKALRASGVDVAHVREGGKFASQVTQHIRELSRDQRNLLMTPRTELMLFLARDLQLIDEAIRPELDRRDVVLADRYLYSAEVLACQGRGLPSADVRRIIEAAAGGLEPDLVVLIDVDPQVARARRRVAKIVERDDKASSRKGLNGVGLQHRMRDGYRRLARLAPERWHVVDNTDADLDDAVARLVQLIQDFAMHGREVLRKNRHPSGATTLPPEARTPAYVVDALETWLDRRAATEPALAAYFVGGLTGERWDRLRERLADAAPAVTAAGLRGLDDAVSWALRERLRPTVPGLVVRSLVGDSGDRDEAWRLREDLADQVPGDVAASLDGRDDERAWALRERLWPAAAARVTGSLRRVDGERAWALRERFCREQGDAALDLYPAAAALAQSLAGLGDERAWTLRERCFQAAPVPALQSLAGVLDERAWRWRSRHVERAGKVIMRSIDGLDDERAWILREVVCLRVKEALDSMIGLDGTWAWRIRDLTIDVWPSTCVKSLGALAQTPRGQETVTRALARHPANLSLWKQTARLAADGTLAPRVAAG